MADTNTDNSPSEPDHSAGDACGSTGDEGEGALTIADSDDPEDDDDMGVDPGSPTAPAAHDGAPATRQQGRTWTPDACRTRATRTQHSPVPMGPTATPTRPPLPEATCAQPTGTLPSGGDDDGASCFAPHHRSHYYGPPYCTPTAHARRMPLHPSPSAPVGAASAASAPIPRPPDDSTDPDAQTQTPPREERIDPCAHELLTILLSVPKLQRNGKWVT